MPRGRTRNPAEDPLPGGLSLLADRDVADVLESRRVPPPWWDRNHPETPKVLGWPLHVLHCAEAVYNGKYRDDLGFICRQDKHFVPKVLLVVAEALDRRWNTPPEKWDWSRLFEELPLNGGSEDIERLIRGEEPLNLPLPTWEELKQFASELRSGQCPTITNSSLDRIAKEHSKFVKRRQEIRERWEPNHQAWASLDSEWWAGPNLPLSWD
jgi:hypothetical protein